METFTPTKELKLNLLWTYANHHESQQKRQTKHSAFPKRLFKELLDAVGSRHLKHWYSIDCVFVYKPTLRCIYISCNIACQNICMIYTWLQIKLTYLHVCIDTSAQEYGKFTVHNIGDLHIKICILKSMNDGKLTHVSRKRQQNHDCCNLTVEHWNFDESFVFILRSNWYAHSYRISKDRKLPVALTYRKMIAIFISIFKRNISLLLDLPPLIKNTKR